jgi:hypothetical protein
MKSTYVPEPWAEIVLGIVGMSSLFYIFIVPKGFVGHWNKNGLSGAAQPRLRIQGM